MRICRIRPSPSTSSTCRPGQRWASGHGHGRVLDRRNRGGSASAHSAPSGLTRGHDVERARAQRASTTVASPSAWPVDEVLQQVAGGDGGRQLDGVDAGVDPVRRLGVVGAGRRVGDGDQPQVAALVRRAVRLDGDEVGVGGGELVQPRASARRSAGSGRTRTSSAAATPEHYGPTLYPSAVIRIRMTGTLVILRHGQSDVEPRQPVHRWHDVAADRTGVAEAVAAGRHDARRRAAVRHVAHLIADARRGHPAPTPWPRWVSRGCRSSGPGASTSVTTERCKASTRRRPPSCTAPSRCTSGGAATTCRRRRSTLDSPEHPVERSALPTPAARRVAGVGMPEGCRRCASLPYWYDVVAPQLLAGLNVLITAHGNSLRALLKHLEDVSDDDIADVNIPTGAPRRYRFDDRLDVRVGRVPRRRRRGRRRGRRGCGASRHGLTRDSREVCLRCTSRASSAATVRVMACKQQHLEHLRDGAAVRRAAATRSSRRSPGRATRSR